MTIWTASVGEILELSAEAVICSANPQLSLSGGVGGGVPFAVWRIDAALPTRLAPALRDSVRDTWYGCGCRRVPSCLRLVLLHGRFAFGILSTDQSRFSYRGLAPRKFTPMSGVPWPESPIGSESNGYVLSGELVTRAV